MDSRNGVTVGKRTLRRCNRELARAEVDPASGTRYSDFELKSSHKKAQDPRNLYILCLFVALFIMMARGGRIEIPNKNNRAADPAGICLRRVWFDVVRTDGVKIERAGLHCRQPIDETGELPRVDLGQLRIGHDIRTAGTGQQPS